MAENETFKLIEQAIELVQKKKMNELADNNIKTKTANVITYDKESCIATISLIEDRNNNEYKIYNKSGEDLNEGDVVKVFYTSNVAKGWIGARMGEPIIDIYVQPNSQGVTLKEYEVLSDTEIKYNGVTYTFSAGDSGEITEVSTDKGRAFTPVIPNTLTNIFQHNAAFMAVAMLSNLSGTAATDIPNCIARWNTDNMIELSSAIVLRDSVGGTGDYSFGGGVVEDGGVKIACTSTSNIGSATLDLGKALSAFTFYYITRGTSGTDRGLHVMASATAQTNTLFEFGSPYANWGALINRGSWLQSGIAETEKVVLCIAYDGTTAQFYVNGNLIGSKSTSLTIPQICYLRNGMTYPSYLDNTPQYIYDLAICDAAHDGATVGEVSAMLMDKYNIGG